ncbi:related to epimerase, PhzC/PhzF homolog [Ramularia collo-cygni]|uniref:Related to epimerase, PhzC/PhzF homolog n=1 Tax=Ramularia collo-cygni TaxID=112498 RepID=A0A2D3V265_9PEZI|nr:related to epimerase, PhzC/PhzF homolog [Ramularia collo-cygni]CZT14333.1 related to epimerase, PhzC/PhzF homolog [Ramularia collo-cygni]
MSPRRLKFVTLDVFTQEKYAGNPLAVCLVPAGEDVSTETMQAIAREFNLSETLFLYETGPQGKEPTWRVRIFITTAELPFAGHPTIGAAVFALGTLQSATKGTFVAGAGPIELSFDGVVAEASIPHNVHIHKQYPLKVADIGATQPSLKGLLESDDAVTVVSPVKGMNFVAVELASVELLSTIALSGRALPKLDDEWNVGFIGSYFYVPTRESRVDGDVNRVELQARMIADGFEDPATGSAACAIGGMIALKRASSRVTQLSILQGVEMGRKSEIGVEVTLNASLTAVERIVLSGAAVRVMEGVVEY